jgi:hypothetical protein
VKDRLRQLEPQKGKLRCTFGKSAGILIFADVFSLHANQINI